MYSRNIGMGLPGKFRKAAAGLILFSGCIISVSAGDAAHTKITVLAEAKAPTWENVVVVVPNRETQGDRWMKFENDFGIHQKSPWWIGRMLQSAKYQVDTMIFGAQEGVRRLEFTYDIGEAPPNGPGSEVMNPQYALPLFGNFGHAQLKTCITQHDPQTGTPFVGVKFNVPFGRKG